LAAPVANPGGLNVNLWDVARCEMRETDVLLLKVRDAAMLEPKISKGGSPVGYMTAGISFGRMIITNQPVSVLANQLDSLLQIPTIDQTGLTNNFDINLKWNRNDSQHNSLKQALLDQLGLELVPSRKPIEMLVVEKVKQAICFAGVEVTRLKSISRFRF
jgi:uncharacterized protein (TIGR03435 family)